MSNEVEVVVKVKDKTSADIAKASAGFKGLARDASKVGDDIDKLSTRIGQTTERVQALGQEFARTGDMDVYRKLREERGALASLQSVRKELQAFADDAERAGRDAGEGLKKGFGSRILGGFSAMGGKAGDVFKNAFTGSGGILGLSPQAVGLISAGLLAGLPAVGSAAAGALVLGFGAGIAGIGIAAAAQNEHVKSSFTGLKNHVVGVAKNISAPFVPALLTISSMFRRTFDSFAPVLASSFASMAPVITTFTGQLLDGFGQLRTAIPPITAAFNALLQSIGPQLPGLFTQLSQAITNVAQSISSNPQTFTNLVTWTFQLATGLTNLIGKLSEAANWFQRNATVTQTLFTALTGGLGPLAASALGIGKNAQATQQMTSAAQQATTATLTEAQALQQLSTALDQVNQHNQGAEQAFLRVEESIDAVTASVKSNGTSLSSNTEKGRANRQSLLSGAQAALAYRDAQIKQKVSLDDANDMLADNRERLIGAARAAGMSRAAATAYIDRLLQIPASRNTQINNNASWARNRVTPYISTLNGIPRVITTTIKQVVYTVGMSGRSEHSVRAAGGISGGAASGGARGHMTLVGEHGPELVNLQPGTMVKSNPDTRRALGMASGGVRGARQGTYAQSLMALLAAARRGTFINEDLSFGGMARSVNSGLLANNFWAANRGFDFNTGRTSQQRIIAWAQAALTRTTRPRMATRPSSRPPVPATGPALPRSPTRVTRASEAAAKETVVIQLNLGGRSFGELIVDLARREVRTRGGDVQAVLGTG